MSTMLHVGDVTHVRHTPFRHRFRYRMWMLSCDIDAPEQSRLFRVDRPALVSLHTKDHGPRDGTPWRPWVAAKLAQAGLAAYGHRIRFILSRLEREVARARVMEDVKKQTEVKISGIDKQQVGEIAAQIRRIRPPEPYKGKGVRYAGEQVRRKEGKKK